MIGHNIISANNVGIYLVGYMGQYPNPIIEYNTFHDNWKNIFTQNCNGCGPIQAQHNWWGTTVPEEIDDTIVDYPECSACPEVDFEPYLLQPPMTIDSVFADPQFFKPTAGESTTIRYTLDRDAYVTVNVYSWDFQVPTLGQAFTVTRTRVATPVKEVFKSAGSNTAVWNGRDDAGALLPFRAYGYTIEPTVADELGLYDPVYNNTCPVALTDSSVTPGFNPYNNERCEVAYYLGPAQPVPAWVMVTIVDTSPQPDSVCRDLVPLFPRRAGANVEYWDGRDKNGRIAAGLPYSVRGWTQCLPVNSIVTEPPALSVTGITCRPYVFRPLFNEITAMKYTISTAARVTLRVFDPADQFVVTLVDEEQLAGEHTVEWDGTDLEGAYVRDSGNYRIEVSLSDGNGGTVSWNGNVMVYR
jgi:hypothetical protein